MPLPTAHELAKRATDLRIKVDSLQADGPATGDKLMEVDREAARLAKDLQELSDWLVRKEQREKAAHA